MVTQIEEPCNIMKLHLCCGTVYLKDYINIDIQGFLRSEAESAGISFNKTTFDNYYTKPLKDKPLVKRGHFVVDLKLDLLLPWPWGEETVDEIVIIQALEHFLEDEVDFIVSESYRVLKKGGKFIFDIPDIVETINQYNNNIINFDMMKRLVYCNQKDQYSVHKNCYTIGTFGKMLYNTNREWSKINWDQLIEHSYPVIGGIATK